jgi:hypothetical protein
MSRRTPCSYGRTSQEPPDRLPSPGYLVPLHYYPFALFMGLVIVCAQKYRLRPGARVQNARCPYGKKQAGGPSCGTPLGPKPGGLWPLAEIEMRAAASAPAVPAAAMASQGPVNRAAAPAAGIAALCSTCIPPSASPNAWPRWLSGTLGPRVAVSIPFQSDTARHGHREELNAVVVRRIADNRGRLVPVRLDGAPVPAPIRHLAWITGGIAGARAGKS